MIRRLSRVADCSSWQYEPPRKDHRPATMTPPAAATTVTAAEGHVPVYVGEDMARFEVRVELLNRPAFAELLRLSAQEYGYGQRGVLRIPCSVALFHRVLASASVAGRRRCLSGGGEEEEEEEEVLLSQCRRSTGNSSSPPRDVAREPFF